MQALQTTLERLRAQHASPYESGYEGLRFIRWPDFEADIRELWAKLPWPISGVIGCPRSGIYAAAKIAILSGVPLWAADRNGPPQPLGHGLRLEQARTRPAGPLILVEDSTNTGSGLQSCRSHCDPTADLLTAVVYPNPDCPIRPDFVGHWLPLPHLFEWHYFGSSRATETAFDLDGVIAEDCPAESDDDGPRYAAWLNDVAPRSLPRTYPAGAIITARLEKYRHETEAWLARHGVQYRTLIMGPWESQRTRNRAAEWKAEQYRQRPRTSINLFIESCPAQAAKIHQITNRPVACNQTGELWS